MASGYLGKISAVVSANTGDYVRKLNESAKATTDFARGVQQSLKRASSDAQKSFQNILLPIQQFERALQNASSMKLSFRGFGGAVRTVNDLKARLASLKDSDVNIVLRASGMRTITELKTAIAGFEQNDIDLFFRFNGLEGLKQARAEIDSLDEKDVTTKVRVRAEELDRAIANFSKIDKQQIDAVIRVIGERELDSAILKERQLFSVAEQINKPLAAAAATLGKLSLSVQAGFIPALSAAQNESEAMGQAIQSGARVGEAEFAKLEARVLKTAEAIGRLGEAQTLASGLKTGAELKFQQPRLEGELTRASSVQADAARLTPKQLTDNPGIAKLVGDVRDLAQRSAEALSWLERVKEAGGDTGPSQAAVGRLTEAIRKQNDELSRQVDLIRVSAQGQSSPVSAQLGAAKAAQEEAAFRERAAEQTEKQSQAANRLLAADIRRRDALKQQQRDFGAGIDTNLTAKPLNIFSGPRNEADALIKETERLAAQFNALDAETRSLLQPLANTLNDAYQSSKAFGIGVDTLAERVAKLRKELELTNSTGLSTSIVGMGQATPLGDNFGAMGARTSLRGVGDRTDISGMGQSSSLSDKALERAMEGLGKPIDDASRQVDVLKSSFIGLKGQIDSLPPSLRSQFIPAIKAAEAELIRLQTAPDATAEEIDNAAAAVRRLGANASAAGRLTQTFAESLNASKLATAEARYSALRSLLLATGKDAGRAGALVDKLGAALGRAAASGNFSALAKEINEIEKEAIQASSAVLGISAKSVASKVNRAGDISRGGVDKFSLALNQAAFAVDDFLSSTGGLEFKLRAVSNNITQLGFVAGGTKGLFIGLAAVIGGQLAVAITKWINDGRSAEDQTKALNESLSKQKSLVEGLAAAYEKVADAVRDAGLSERGRRDAGIRRQVEDIQRQQRQARDERILGLDVGVAAARGSVAKAERELGASTTVGQRARAEIELNAARQRQREEERRALEQAGSPLGGIREAVISEIASQIERETQGAFAGARAAAAASGGFGGQGAFAAARETERRNNERIAALQGIGGSPEEAIAALDERINQLVKSGASGDVILPLQQLRERILVYTKQLEGDRLASRISEGVLRIVDAMESANADISSAFDGVRGASAIESDLASFGETLAQFQRAAAEAAGRGDVGQVQAINEDINAINAHIAALRDAAAAVRVFGSELQRLSQSVAQDLSSLEQRAEDARRADVGAGTDASRQQRDQAESDARDARRAQRQFEDQRASATERFEQDARANNDPRFRRVREIDAMLAVPMNEVGADGRTRGGTAQERDAARTERRALQESIDNSVENDPAVAEARRQRDAMTARAQEAQSIDRGRELSLTPGQRASEQLNQELQDIRNYFNKAAEESTGLPEDVAKIRGEMNDALARAEEDVKRQVAPAVFALQDARENALLQGPSRAALGASDVTTMQGQAELNRLLRGDDPAKDVNLLELQKQTKLLEDIAKNEVPVI